MTEQTIGISCSSFIHLLHLSCAVKLLPLSHAFTVAESFIKTHKQQLLPGEDGQSSVSSLSDGSQEEEEMTEQEQVYGRGIWGKCSNGSGVECWWYPVKDRACCTTCRVRGWQMPVTSGRMRRWLLQREGCSNKVAVRSCSVRGWQVPARSACKMDTQRCKGTRNAHPGVSPGKRVWWTQRTKE
eukprot:1156257-Pelagomonas_calceolata.AAC.10